jgi:hypothetical protein
MRTGEEEGAGGITGGWSSKPGFPAPHHFRFADRTTQKSLPFFPPPYFLSLFNHVK